MTETWKLLMYETADAGLLELQNDFAGGYWMRVIDLVLGFGLRLGAWGAKFFAKKFCERGECPCRQQSCRTPSPNPPTHNLTFVQQKTTHSTSNHQLTKSFKLKLATCIFARNCQTANQDPPTKRRHHIKQQKHPHKPNRSENIIQK